MRKKTSSEYLAFLSAKYEVDPDRLFYARALDKTLPQPTKDEFLV